MGNLLSCLTFDLPITESFVYFLLHPQQFKRFYVLKTEHRKYFSLLHMKVLRKVHIKCRDQALSSLCICLIPPKIYIFSV